MLPREVIRQIRRLQLKARRAVEDLLGGEYHSVFKGTGIAFEEVREYQPGDDIRAIDWNVTARMGHPFIKRFIEERELTVMLVVDCSGSNRFGTRVQQKREVAAELAAVLAFSAITNSDRVGLVAFTDRVERFVPPRKGTRHVLRLIRDVLFFQPAQRGTSLREGLDYVNRVLHRRAIIFLLSDFRSAGRGAGLQRDHQQRSRRPGRLHRSRRALRAAAQGDAPRPPPHSRRAVLPARAARHQPSRRARLREPCPAPPGHHFPAKRLQIGRPRCWPSARSPTAIASAWSPSPIASSASCRRARGRATSSASFATCCSSSPRSAAPAFAKGSTT